MKTDFGKKVLVLLKGAQQPNRGPVGLSRAARNVATPSTHWNSLAVAIASPCSHKWPLLVRGSP